MKKLLLLLFIIFGSIGLVACNQDDNNQSGDEPDTEQNPDNDIKVQDLSFKYNMHEIILKENPNTNIYEEYFYFGYYPQREIYDTKLLEALNKIHSVNERGYIEYNGMEFAKVTIINNHIYAKLDDSVTEENADQLFTSGTGYEVGAVHYFLVEPLSWKVCKNSNGVLTLLSENVIDTHIYSQYTEERIINGVTVYPSNYEHSDIRAWLNGPFVDICFTEEEKALLLNTELKNEANLYEGSGNNPVKDNKTTDKVYILSFQEVSDSKYGYGLSGAGTTLFTRYAPATDYARAKGSIKHVIDNNNSSNWMIRTSHIYSRLHICFGGYDGYFEGKLFYPDAPNMGVRVACRINFY